MGLHNRTHPKERIRQLRIPCFSTNFLRSRRQHQVRTEPRKHGLLIFITTFKRATSSFQIGKDSPAPDPVFLDEFPSVPPTASGPDGTPEAWAVDFHNHIQEGDLVVPSGQYFMMGDHRHSSLDSRYWGFVPRENVVGRPILNYWSFNTPDEQYDKKGLSNSMGWIGHVALHFFTDTRWNRTLKRIR